LVGGLQSRKSSFCRFRSHQRTVFKANFYGNTLRICFERKQKGLGLNKQYNKRKNCAFAISKQTPHLRKEAWGWLKKQTPLLHKEGRGWLKKNKLPTSARRGGGG
jgi:hypothetical protein